MESKSIYSHLKPFLPEHVAYTNRFRFYRYACPSWGRKTVAEGVRGGNCECEDAQDKPVLPDSPRATLVLWTSLARLPIKNESVRNTRRRRRLETFLRFTVQSNFHRLRHPNRFREILCKTLRKRFPPRTTWRDLTRRTWRWKFSRRWKVRKKCGRSFKYALATRTNEESVGVTGQLIGREIPVDTFSSSNFQVATCCIGISVIALVVHDRCWSRVGYWSDFFMGSRGWVK